MAELKAKAAGGLWSAKGTWEPEQVPTSEDDVKLNASSGNVTMDAAALCRSIDCTGYTGKLKLEVAKVKIGTTTVAENNVALKFVAGMTFEVTSASTSEIEFVSTAASVQTIDFAGKNTGRVLFNGAGGSWKYEGEHKQENSSSVVSLTRGTLDLNGKNVTWGIFQNNESTSTRTITLGSSVITITNPGNGLRMRSTGLTVNAGTSKFVMSGTAAQATLESVAINDIEFTGSGISTLAGNFTCNNFKKVATAVKTDVLSVGSSNVTVTGKATFEGNSVTNRLLVQGSALTGEQKTFTAAEVALKWVDFRDIKGAGAATWSGTSLGDQQGNSGITFTVSATQTFVGGTKNWSDATSWTSRVPLPQDDVVVATTGAGTLTMDMPVWGRNIDFTGCTQKVSIAVTTPGSSFFGSMTLGSGMTLSTTASTNTTAARGRSGSPVVTCNGINWPVSFTIFAPNVTYKLGSDFLMSGTRTFVVQASAIFDANGKNVTIPHFQGVASGKTKMGSGTWKMNSTLSEWACASSHTVEAESSTISYVTSTTTRVFLGGGSTYNIIDYTIAGSTGALEIQGSNTFGEFKFSDTTNARTLIFQIGTTNTILKWAIQGTGGKLMTIQSSTGGTQFTLRNPSGIVETDYLVIKDSVADGKGSGRARWLAGFHSEDKGNNTGWEFNVTPEVKKGGATGSGAGSASAIVVRRKRAKENSASASGSVTVKIKRRLRTGATGSGTGTATSTGTMRIAVGGGHGSANSFVSDVSVRRRFGRAQGSGTGSASGKQTAIFVGSAEGDGSALGLSIGVQRRRRGGASGEAEGSADSGDAFRLRSPGESRAQGESSVNGEGNLIAVGGGVAEGISEAVLALLQDHLPGRGVLDHQPTGSAELEHDTSVATIEREP